MTRQSDDAPPRITARSAGLLYLVIIACGIFAEVGVRASLIAPAAPGATAAAIRASEDLFRLGVVKFCIVLFRE